MKQPVPVAAVMIGLFLAAQLIGLFVVRSYVDVQASEAASEEAGQPVAVYQSLPYGFERPEIAPDFSFIFLGLAIAAGTVLMLFLIRLKAVSLWKAWFFFAVLATLTVAFSAFIPALAAASLAAIIAFFRVMRPNVLVHNLSELFMYGGLAAIFVPIISIKSAFILLAAIAVYDFFAVFMSGHMISLAKFQANNRIFAGLFVPKQLSVMSAVSEIKLVSAAKQLPNDKSDSGNYAIVGGGDIGFPLMFAGSAMASIGMRAFIIPFFAAAALTALFIIGRKGRFYPAMPFIAAGCFAGYFVISMT